MVMIICIMAVIVLIGVAAASWLIGDTPLALIDLTAALALSILLVIFWFSPYKQACRYAGVAMMYCLYLYLFITGAAGGISYMWHYTFPFFAIFLLGANHGAVATISLFIPVFIIVIKDSLTPDLGLYSVHFASRFIPSVSVALVFAYLFEKERERFRQLTLKAYREQERIIEERTKQLTQRIDERDRMAEKLRRSQKMEAIGTMASGVAHDLNNILSGIVTYPELLRKGLPVDSNLAGPLKLIEQAGKRAAAVVSDLLTLARNSASVKEACDINMLIRDLINSPEWNNIVTQHSQVDIKVNLNATLPMIYCSQTHIRKCLMNLLLNGLEATSPKGTVTISTENIPRNGSREKKNSPGFEQQDILITVIDDGQGISPEHINHIFEPFYTTKKMGKSGSGLGLSVVWNTIEEHEGAITVANTNPGVVFKLKFPVTKRELSGELKPTSLALASYKGTGSILVVDDEPHLREIASEIVKNLGYMVTAVTSGEEALAHIAKCPADIVLLDMVLGDGIGGHQTYQKMIELNPRQKAVIVSGYSTNEDVRKTLKLGACSFVKKPYTIEQLSRAIKDCLENSARHQAHQ
ncbi:MAG: response regulator [Desulfobulbaceae bacterium]|nr:response regulator [Desulfobulbaceae bacterium]